MGNRITQILCPLPVYIEDPVARLHFVREAMGGLKESKQALGAAMIAGRRTSRRRRSSPRPRG